jgi:hypothetical protein
MGETCMKTALRPALKPLALALSLLGAAAPLHAFQFNLGNEAKGSFDTTITYGVSVRADGRDPTLNGIANGGTTRSVNEDDGDRNFDKGKPFANIIKATSDLELKWRNFGFFGRGTAYYDFDLHDSDKLGPTGKDRLGQDVVGLDGFFFASFEPWGKNLRLRVGRQVISWGESTFIQNGINVVNPIDVSRIRVPGSELKEALIPTAGIWASQELTKDLTVEGFYLTNFDKTRIDPRGSYFSSNDYASDDGSRVYIGFGRRRDQGSLSGLPFLNPGNPIPEATPTAGPIARALYGPFDPTAAIWAGRSADREASDSGQYGIAFRYLAKDFNNTEFGFYHLNYHSRTPVFSGIKGTVTSAVTGGPLMAAIGHTGTGTYFAEYPEDIRLYGMSFNTQGPAGIAFQGEYSYRPNQPVQLATTELLLASLGAPNFGITCPAPCAFPGAQIPGAPAGATAAALVPNGTYIQGWRPLKMSQLQFTGTKSWPNVLNAEQAVLLGEVGFTWFHGLPGDLRFNGPALHLPATQFGAIAGNPPALSVQNTGFLTDFSWGLRIAGRLDYNNVIYGGNLSPRFAYSDDIRGISPTFNEKAKSFSLGLAWDYPRKWVVDVQYTGYFGGRSFCGTDALPPGVTLPPGTILPSGITSPGSIPNGQSASWCSGAYPLKDRDFYSFTISYSF